MKIDEVDKWKVVQGWHLYKPSLGLLSPNTPLHCTTSVKTDRKLGKAWKQSHFWHCALTARKCPLCSGSGTSSCCNVLGAQLISFLNPEPLWLHFFPLFLKGFMWEQLSHFPLSHAYHWINQQLCAYFTPFSYTITSRVKQKMRTRLSNKGAVSRTAQPSRVCQLFCDPLSCHISPCSFSSPRISRSNFSTVPRSPSDPGCGGHSGNTRKKPVRAQSLKIVIVTTVW